MAPLLAYFDARGLAEPIRYALTYSGVEFEDRRYKERSELVNDRAKLGLDFPNSPFFIDGDIKLTQSLAILRHVARANKLDGKNEAEKCRIELAEQQLNDYNQAFGRLLHSKEFDEQKPEYVKNLSQSLEQFSKFLGSGPFVAGENVTYVDFLAYEVLDKNKALAPEVVSNAGNLMNFMERIEALPRIAEYLKTSNRKFGFESRMNANK